MDVSKSKKVNHQENQAISQDDSDCLVDLYSHFAVAGDMPAVVDSVYKVFQNWSDFVGCFGSLGAGKKYLFHP